MSEVKDGRGDVKGGRRKEAKERGKGKRRVKRMKKTIEIENEEDKLN